MEVIESVKKKLQSQYQIDVFVFLEDLETLPSSTFYKTLNPWIKESYQPDYKFVFFNFSPLKFDTLKHVSNVIKTFDISPYFVLVITNQPATADFFSCLPEPISTDFLDHNPNRIAPNIATPVFNVDNRMCAHAWAGLHIQSTGEAALCCQFGDNIKDSNGINFNIKTHDIKEIFESEYIDKIRQQFRSGQTPEHCKICVLQEANGGESKRNLATYKLKNIYGDIDWEDAGKFNWLGGHLGNLCNLKCRICNEHYSSTIAAEKLKQLPSTEIKLHKVYKTLLNNNWNTKDSEFWKSVQSLTPQIKNFEILGGEPLINSPNIEFMQYLLDNNYSQDCIFEIVTNGTQYPSVFDHAHKFKELNITVSIDNIGKRFEYERSGADWHLVDSNLTKFIASQQQNNNVKIGISITVNIQNVLYLPELLDYLNSKQVNHYFINMLFTPHWMSLDSLTPEAKQLTLHKLINASLDKKDSDKLIFVINQIKQSKTSDGKLFCKKMKELDALRKENFANTHTEIANAMGYMLN